MDSRKLPYLSPPRVLLVGVFRLRDIVGREVELLLQLLLLVFAVDRRSVFALPENGADGSGGLVLFLSERYRMDQLKAKS